MQLRTRVAVLLAVALIAAACLATCDRDNARPGDPRATDTTDATNATDTTDATARPVRPPRRRATRPRAPTAEVPPAVDDGAIAFGDRSFGKGASVGLLARGGAMTIVREDDSPTGRVRVQMLKDGRPFAGGHVCFFREAWFVEPGPWDGTSCSDGAYTGLPKYTSMWPHFDPVLGSAAPVRSFEAVRGVTGSDGFVTLDVPAGRSLVTFVRYAMSGIPLVSQPRVNVAAGGEVSLTIEAARMRTVVGRCLDGDGEPLAGIFVQAVAPREERPLSRTVESSATGAFELSVMGEDSEIRVRAVVPYVAHPLGIYDSEAEVPSIPAETTVTGIVPGGGPVDVWMPDAPLVFIELTGAGGEAPPGHLQIEGLAFDPRAAAWGRLGGPQYRRTDGNPAGRRAVIALPRAEAERPLMLWSWGWTITAVDPRGLDHVSVEIPRGRWAGVRGRGWQEHDRLRVVAFCGPAGREIPCIWIDGVIGATDQWSRGNSPVSAIEFQIVRDGVVVGRSERVPPGTDRATEVSIDLE